MRKRCLICGKRLKNAPIGRKRVYCSIPCRRQRERILARLRRIVGRLLNESKKPWNRGNGYLAAKIKRTRKELADELAKR